MKRVLLASDLDGTLLRGNEISEEDLEAVRRLSGAGHLFAVSTGRPYNGVERLLERYGLKPEYMVLANGALILGRDREVIRHEVIALPEVREITRVCQELGFEVSYDTGYRSYAYQYDFPKAVLDSIPGCRRIDSLEALPEAVSLISAAANHGVERTEEALQAILDRFGDRVAAFRNLSYIDVVPKETSKGSGLRTVMEREGLSRDAVFAIGDSMNDLSMFLVAGHSFTFHEVEDMVKAAAGKEVASVAECIHEHILGR